LPHQIKTLEDIEKELASDASAVIFLLQKRIALFGEL
jgi:hypothetical protein